jgi:enamine deaminase RidA (YjgF/YER057c/UK114 family)
MIENREVRIFNPETISKPNGYSHVAEVTSGKLVYIAGQVAMDKDGQIVGKGDFGAQVRQVFVNLETALKAVGGSFSDVVKLNCYVVDGVESTRITGLSPDTRRVCQRAIAAGKYARICEESGESGVAGRSRSRCSGLRCVLRGTKHPQESVFAEWFCWTGPSEM